VGSFDATVNAVAEDVTDIEVEVEPEVNARVLVAVAT